MNEVLELFKPLLEIYGSSVPFIVKAFAFVGMARVTLKPWQVILPKIRELIMLTPTTKDDEILNKVESSKAYNIFKFVIDYVLSVKLK
jgi:hypothetical protein